MDFDEGIHAADVAVTEAVQLIGAKTMRGTNPDEASETGEFEDLEVRPVWKRLRCIWLHLWNIWYMVAVLLRAVRGIVRSMVIVAILILLLVQTGQAEEAEHELLWRYEVGDYVEGVSISADGSYIAAGSDHNKVYLFNRAGELLWSCKIGGDDVKGVSIPASISADGSYIAAGSGWDDDKVYLFNRAGELLWSYQAGDDVEGVSISADGSYIAAGSGWDDDKVYLFNRAGELLWSYQAGDFVEAVSISSDGSYIAAGSEGGGNVYLFNRAGELLWSYQTGGYFDFVYGVSISSDGSYIATGSAGAGDDKVCFFNREGELLWSYGIGNNVYSVSISSDGSYIAAGSGEADDNVYLFNRAGELLWSYKTGDDVHDVSISSNGSCIAVGSGNKVYFFTDLVTDLEGLFKVIEVVKTAMELERAKGFNMEEVETLLSNAEDAFSIGDYAKASELVGVANALALDIDQDGVSNDADFAPAIDNYLIYAGAAILLVVLVIAIITGLKVIERFKLERERKEERHREQERTEQERLRREANERRRKIQKILDKIKEVM